MNKDYRFTSDEEPTDEQLAHPMLAVLEDVKKTAATVLAQYQIWLKKAVANAQAQNALRELKLTENRK